MQANSQGDVVNAAMLQRTAPAPVASIMDPLQPIRRRSQGPISRNTTTSANTDSDQSALMVKKSIPALCHRITEKESCIAWLPHSSEAAISNRRYGGLRSRKRPSRRIVARSPSDRSAAASFGSDGTTAPPRTSRPPLIHIAAASPDARACQPPVNVPRANSIDPAARTQPYSNLPALSLRLAPAALEA